MSRDRKRGLPLKRIQKKAGPKTKETKKIFHETGLPGPLPRQLNAAAPSQYPP